MNFLVFYGRKGNVEYMKFNCRTDNRCTMVLDNSGKTVFIKNIEKYWQKTQFYTVF